MIRFVLYSTLVSLMCLSASAQEAVRPDIGGSPQERLGASAAEAQDVGQASAKQGAGEVGKEQQPTAGRNSAPQAVEPDPQAPIPAAAEPNPERGSSAAVPSARSRATMAPRPRAQKHVAVKPRARHPKPRSMAQKYAVVKPKAKHPKHVARRDLRGPAYRGGYRGPRYSYRWAYSPWYGYYLYRPGYYPSYSYHPTYR